MDGYAVHGDVLLMRIPEEKYRERQEFRKMQAEAARDGVSSDWLEKGRDLAARYGLLGGEERPVYFRKLDHGTTNF